MMALHASNLGGGDGSRFRPWKPALGFVWLGLALACSVSVQACRYNVRDLGFIEVESEGYVLHWLLPEKADPETVDFWNRTLAPVFEDTNVRWDPLRAGDLDGHPHREHLEPALARALPAAVLVSPDGFATNLFAARPGPPSPEESLAQLRAWTTSPTRLELARAAARAFGVILLFEGRDESANGVARREIDQAIAEIKDGMATLPKAIVEPPVLVRLPVDAVAREHVLFWSMGIEARAIEQPRAAIFYGRARWIGPLIEMVHLNAANLTRLFWIIGADCECGMDLAWTRGTTLPARWDTETHAVAARGLGFDPDSPMVRAEALRILNRYSRSPLYAAARASTADSDPADVGAAVFPARPEPEAGGPTNAVPSAEASPEVKAESEGPSDRAGAGRILLILAIIGLIILLGTLLVLLTAMHRWRESARPRQSLHSRGKPKE